MKLLELSQAISGLHLRVLTPTLKWVVRDSNPRPGDKELREVKSPAAHCAAGLSL
jgi:hypothetical protein